MSKLDIGSGHLHSHIARGDINIDIKRPKVRPKNLIQADGYHLPILDNSFDKTFLYDIIEHVENPTKLMKEAFRVLKPHGLAEITTPNPWHWRKIFRVARGKKIILSGREHIATWTQAEIENLLMNVGFKDVHVTYITLPVTRIFGSHPILDRLMEKLLPSPIATRSIKVRARKCIKQ